MGNRSWGWNGGMPFEMASGKSSVQVSAAAGARQDAHRGRGMVSVDERVVVEALGVLAAVIEEPRCTLECDELRRAVSAWRGLWKASGLDDPDYAFRRGAVVSARDGRLVKQGVEVAS